jgi:hypothetical protein
MVAVETLATDGGPRHGATHRDPPRDGGQRPQAGGAGHRERDRGDEPRRYRA